MRKPLFSIVVVLFVLIMMVPSASAQQSVTLDVSDGVFDGCSGAQELIPDYDVVFRLRVTNQGGDGCAFDPSFNFRIYSTDGAEWVDTWIDTAWGFGMDWFGMWHKGAWSVTGSGADTVGLELIVLEKSGLIDGFNEVGLLIRITPTGSSLGKTICLDTGGVVDPQFVWQWDGLSGCDDLIPEWDGPHCFEVGYPPHPMDFDDPPHEITGNHCEQFSYDFDAIDPMPGAGPGPDDILYEIVEGPGQIDQNTGLWTWDGMGVAPGESTTLRLMASQADNCPSPAMMSVQLIVNEGSNQAPYFSSGCRSTVLVSRGEQASITLQGYDTCPNDSVYAELLQTDAVGEVIIEGTTISFTPDPADMSQVAVRVIATDGIDIATEWCEVYFQILECDGCACCGYYAGGFTGNIDFDMEGNRNLADITMLIDRVYVSKKPLLCTACGNVDGDPTSSTNLADITRLIDHVYVSKEETAACVY